jgi:hypothetical protein
LDCKKILAAAWMINLRACTEPGTAAILWVEFLRQINPVIKQRITGVDVLIIKGKINISGLPAGIYFLKNNETGIVQKVIVIK